MSALCSWPNSTQDPLSTAPGSRRRLLASRRTGSGKPEIGLFRQAEPGRIRKAVTTVLALPAFLALAGCVGGTQSPLLELFPPERQEMPGAPETKEETPAPQPDPGTPATATEETESGTDTRSTELAPSPPPVQRSSPPPQARQVPTPADGNSVSFVESSEPQSARQTRQTSSSSVPDCVAGWGGGGHCKYYNIKVLIDFRKLVGTDYVLGPTGYPKQTGQKPGGSYLSRFRFDGYINKGWGFWAVPNAPSGRGKVDRFGLYVYSPTTTALPFAKGHLSADTITIATGTGTATWRGGLIATDLNDASLRPIVGKTKVTMDVTSATTTASMKVNFTDLHRVEDDTRFTSLGNLPESTLTRVTDKNLWVTSGSPATSLTTRNDLRVMGQSQGDQLVPIYGSKTATDEVTAAFFNKPGATYGPIWGTVTSTGLTGIKLNGSWAAEPQ